MKCLRRLRVYTNLYVVDESNFDWNVARQIWIAKLKGAETQLFTLLPKEIVKEILSHTFKRRQVFLFTEVIPACNRIKISQRKRMIENDSFIEPNILKTSRVES
jgi:hypothetical protein